MTVCPIEADARRIAALLMLAYIEDGQARDDALVIGVPVAAGLLQRLDFGEHAVRSPELVVVTDEWLNRRLTDEVIGL